MTTKKTIYKSPLLNKLANEQEDEKKTIKTPLTKKKMKNKGGRPSQYNKELLVKAREYGKKYQDLGHVIPSIAGLALYRGVSRAIIYVWSADEDKQEFLDILDDILSEQEFTLINKGLSGDFNPAITKLVLGKHGYHERRETEVSGKGGKPIRTESVHRDLTQLPAKEAERIYDEFASND